MKARTFFLVDICLKLAAIILLTCSIARGQCTGGGIIENPYPLCHAVPCGTPPYSITFRMLASSECQRVELTSTGSAGAVLIGCGSVDSLMHSVCLPAGPLWVYCPDSLFLTFIGPVGDSVKFMTCIDGFCERDPQTACTPVGIAPPMSPAGKTWWDLSRPGITSDRPRPGSIWTDGKRKVFLTPEE